MSRLPPVRIGKRVAIICEGFEETDYMNKLNSCGVWNPNIIVDIKNAKSIDSISSMYQYYYQNEYELVVVFCDTEKEPYDQFLKLKKSIDDSIGNHASDFVVYFANPCTMQIILSHFDLVRLKNNEKSKNAKLIEKLTGVSDYNAKESQRKAIMRKITSENYFDMKSRISKLNKDYNVVPSSNCIILFEGLDGTNAEWVEKTARKIEE